MIMFVRMVICTWLLSLAHVHFHVESSMLELVHIIDAQARGAVCNDRTSAGYYVDAPRLTDFPQFTDRWIIYIQGGGGCQTDADCWYRWTHDNEYMSSRKWAPFRKGTDLLSSDSRENPPFFRHRHVFIPYCSSDMWFGQNANVTVDVNKSQFAFAGSIILRSVLEDLELLSPSNLTTREIIMAGTSAGGIAVLNHAPWIWSALQALSTFVAASRPLKLIIDSAWFVKKGGELSRLLTPEYVERIHVSHPNIAPHAQACFATATVSQPDIRPTCCLFASCMLRHFVPPSIPVFSISSLFDAYLLNMRLNLSDVVTNSIGLPQALLVNNNLVQLGTQMNESYVNHELVFPQLSAIILACITHAVFVCDNICHSFPTDVLKGSTCTGQWGLLSVGGVSVRSAIMQWYNTMASPLQVATALPTLLWRDWCPDVLCNPSCNVVFRLEAAAGHFTPWSSGDASTSKQLEWIVGSLWVGCLLACIVMYTCMFVMRRRYDHAFEDERKLTTSPACGTMARETTTGLAGDKTRLTWSNIEVRVQTAGLCGLSPPEGSTTCLVKSLSGYVEGGELMAVMGSSGCGKTTLIQTLVHGRSSAQRVRGDIHFNGIPFTDCRAWRDAFVGFVAQNDAVDIVPGHFTVLQDLNYTATLVLPKNTSTALRIARVGAVMSAMQLHKQSLVRVLALSGGQRRRLAVAREIMCEPRILLLDEPTSGLDAATSLHMMQCLRGLANRGCAVLVTIHQPRVEIFELFDKVYVMSHGTNVYTGGPTNLLRHIRNVAAMTLQAPLHVVSTDIAQALRRSSLTQNPADGLLDILNHKAAMNVCFPLVPSGHTPLIRLSRESPCGGKHTVLHARDHAEVLRANACMRMVVYHARISANTSVFQMVYAPVASVCATVIFGWIFRGLGNDVSICVALFLVVAGPGSEVLGLVSTDTTYVLTRQFIVDQRRGFMYPGTFLLQVMCHITTTVVLPCTCFYIGLFVLVFGLKWRQMLFTTIIQTANLHFLCAVNQLCVQRAVTTNMSYHGAHVNMSFVRGGVLLLSGFLIPSAYMPAPLQVLCWLNPLYWSMQGLIALNFQSASYTDTCADAHKSWFACVMAMLKDSSNVVQFSKLEPNRISYVGCLCLILFGDALVHLLMFVILRRRVDLHLLPRRQRKEVLIHA
jgi:ABC-type multidrug transport system ATPase subunit